MKNKPLLASMAPLHLPAIIFAASFAVTGCGGSSSSSSNDGGNTPTIGGKSGENPCVTEDVIDLRCYIVPAGEKGEKGEKITVEEDAYKWESGKFVNKGVRSRTYSIRDKEATVTSVGASKQDPLDYTWDDDNFTITTEKNFEITFPRNVTDGEKEQIFHTPDGEKSIPGSMAVFGPKKRTITIPTTGDTLTINNAVMRVKVVPDSKFVSLTVLAPEMGEVAAVSYDGCDLAATGNLELKDDINYYEEECGHDHPRYTNVAALRVPDAGDEGGPDDENDSGSSGSIDANYIKSQLPEGNLNLFVQVTDFDPNAIKQTTVKSVGLPSDATDFCEKFQQFSWDLYDPGHTWDSSNDDCTFGSDVGSGVGSGTVSSAEGQVSYTWTN